MAAEKYGIPKSTLSDYRKNANNIKKPGGQMVLFEKDETMLVEGLVTCAEWGFPLDASDMHIVVQSCLNRSGKLAGVSKPILTKYFDNLEVVLEDVPTSVKHPEIIRDSSTASTSVMFCAAADGKIVPPYTVYKSTYLYPSWIEGGVPGARFNRNSSGWFDMKMLKNALNTVESLESNVKVGFMAAGIVPFNKDRVLSRVKSRPEDQEHEAVRNSSWSQAFVEILLDVRLEDKVVGKKPRGKKVAVEPGKNAEDSEEDIDDPEFDENVLINDENQPSTSGPITTQPESSTDFEIDDFILIRYDTGESYRKYMGQVISVDYPLFLKMLARDAKAYIKFGSP
ncbi:HTH psq-type domain-containing protein [Aphis craccivora]|uniref:HTH psq-type domain-containing protein n=1 Tax=Aphis craccivora TaxID=307492 RepID=A0A6G0YG04_APHCR|nr:HTH psq-type domain-containing protein [Aphis craccivora]